MDTDTLSNMQIYLGIAVFAGTGWNLYIQLQKRRIEEKLRDLESRCFASDAKIGVIEKAYWSRNDHKEFRFEIMAVIDKLETSLVAAINRLTDKIEDRG